MTARIHTRGGQPPSVRYGARWRSLPVEGAGSRPWCPNALLLALLGCVAVWIALGAIIIH